MSRQDRLEPSVGCSHRAGPSDKCRPVAEDVEGVEVAEWRRMEFGRVKEALKRSQPSGAVDGVSRH